MVNILTPYNKNSISYYNHRILSYYNHRVLSFYNHRATLIVVASDEEYVNLVLILNLIN